MIHLNYRDARPIYSQIVDNFRQQITAGILQPGDQLPSVRELAGHLAINPNTIQRAYRELESCGLIATVPGKGCFVTEQKVTDPSLLTHWQALEEAARQLKALGVTTEELVQHIRQGGKENA